jgi:hypothetical protein
MKYGQERADYAEEYGFCQSNNRLLIARRAAQPGNPVDFLKFSSGRVGAGVLVGKEHRAVRLDWQDVHDL